MPKIYPDKQPIPEQKRDDTEPGRKTMGVYDRPKRKGPSRGAIFAIVIALLIIIGILFLSGFTMAADMPLSALTAFVEPIVESGAGS